MKRIEILGRCLVMLALAPASFGGDAPRSDVPMTRPEEAISVQEGIGADLTGIERADGKILVWRGKGRFSTSADRGSEENMRKPRPAWMKRFSLPDPAQR
jgi:hypothetical protein